VLVEDTNGILVVLKGVVMRSGDGDNGRDERSNGHCCPAQNQPVERRF